MISPLIFSKFLNVTIDLSQLSEVSNAYFSDRMGHGGYFVGFNYVSSGVRLKFERYVRVGSYRKARNITEEEIQQDKTIECVFEKERNRLIYDGEEIRAVKNLQIEIDELISQWSKWKQIEPEIYAIVKKHLSN